MFSQTNYRRPMISMGNYPTNGYSQDIQMQQQPMQNTQYCLPMTANDNFSCYSSASTASGMTQMSSIYIANQKKKTLTDEIIACLNTTIEGLLPSIAQQSAEAIYKSIIPYMEKQNNEIQQLQKQIEHLEQIFKKSTFLTNNSTPMKNMNSIATSLNDINSNVISANSILENQITFDRMNQGNASHQIKRLMDLKQQMENVKKMLVIEKNKTKRVNNEINDAFSNIVGMKQIIENKVNNFAQEFKGSFNGMNCNIAEEGIKIRQLESLVNCFYKEIADAEQLKIDKKPKINYFQKQKFCF